MEVFKCYYSKDLRKKHKVFQDGFIVYEEKKVKLYSDSAEIVHDIFKSRIFHPNPDDLS